MTRSRPSHRLLLLSTLILAAGCGGGTQAGSGTYLDVPIFDVAEKGWGDAPLPVHYVWQIHTDSPSLDCQIDLDGDGTIDKDLPGCAADTTTASVDGQPSFTFNDVGEHTPRLIVSDGTRTVEVKTTIYANRVVFAPGVVVIDRTPGYVSSELTWADSSTFESTPPHVLITYASADKVPVIAPGTVVWGGLYVMRVTSANPSGRTLALDGTPAVITDAIQDAFLGARDVRSPYELLKCPFPSCGDAIVEVLPPQSEPVTVDTDGGVTLTGQTEGVRESGLDINLNKGFFGLKIRLGTGGSNDYTHNLFFGLDVKKFVLQIGVFQLKALDVEMVPQIKYEFNMVANAYKSSDLSLLRIPIAVVPLPPLAIWINLDLTAKFQLDFQLGFNVQVVTPFKIHYTAIDGWDFTTTPNFLGDFGLTREWAVGLQAQLNVTPRIQATIPGAGGPFVAPLLQVTGTVKEKLGLTPSGPNVSCDDPSYVPPTGRLACVSGKIGVGGQVGFSADWFDALKRLFNLMPKDTLQIILAELAKEVCNGWCGGRAPAALVIAPSSFDFGAVVQGTTSPATTFTVRNQGAEDTGVILSLSPFANQFSITSDTCNGNKLAAGGMCQITVVFSPPLNGSLSYQSALSVQAGPGGYVEAMVTGTALMPGAALWVTPKNVDFGAFGPGTMSAPTTFQVTNNGALATSAITMSLTGAVAGQYAIVNDMCSGGMLAPMQSCTVGVVFQPDAMQAAGIRRTTLQASAMTGGMDAANITGTVLGQANAMLVIAPQSNDFGNAPAGTMTPAVAFTVTNVGMAATSAISVALAGPDLIDFSIVNDACGGTQLAAGKSCVVTAQFAPNLIAMQGSRNATLKATAMTGGIAAASLMGKVAPKPQTIDATCFEGTTISVPPAPNGLYAAATMTIKNVTEAFGGIQGYAALLKFPEVGNESTKVPADAQVFSFGDPNDTSGVPGFPNPVAGRNLNRVGRSNLIAVWKNAQTGSYEWLYNVTAGHYDINGQITTYRQYQFIYDARANPKYIFQSYGSSDGNQWSQVMASSIVDPPGSGAATVVFPRDCFQLPEIGITPATRDFGNVPPGQSSAEIAFVVKNRGTAPTSAISTMLGGTDAAQFAVTSDGCSGQMLGGGLTCQIKVKFSPGNMAALGAKSAMLTVKAASGGSDTAVITGTVATAGLFLSPSDQDYGLLLPGGTSPDVTFTLSNTGNLDSSVVTFALQGADAASFNVTGGTCVSGVTLVKAGMSCTITASFAPGQNAPPGPKAATLQATAMTGGTTTASLHGGVLAVGGGLTSWVYATSANGVAGFFGYEIGRDTWSQLPSPPDVTYSQITSDGAAVYLLTVGNDVVKYTPANRTWSVAQTGPGANDAGMPTGYFKWTPGGLFYARSGATDLQASVMGGAWSSTKLPAMASCAGSYDATGKKLYIRELGTLGVMIYDVVQKSAIEWPLMTACMEDSRCGFYSNGFFYDRATGGAFQKIDVATGTSSATNATPVEADVSTDVNPATGDVFLGPSSAQSHFQLYKPAMGTIVNLANAPAAIHDHSTIVFVP